MKKTEMYKVKGGEVFIPKRTMELYKSSNDDEVPLNSDRELLRDMLELDHPEVYDLINRVTRFTSPMLFSPDEDLLLKIVFEPAMEYLQNAVITNKERARKVMTKKLLRNLASVFNYSVYASTSGERIDAVNTHWDPSLTTMRDWIKRHDVNKMIVAYQPITTKLNELKLSFLSSRHVFNLKEMNELLHTFTVHKPGNRTSYIVSQNDSDAQTEVSNDVLNALEELKFYHPRLEETCLNLSSYLGFDIKYGDTALVDILLMDAFSCFAVTNIKYGVSEAYSDFIRSLTSGLTSVFDFSVEEVNTKDAWKQCFETYKEYRFRQKGKKLRVEHGVDIRTPTDVDYVYAILPLIMSRKDLVSLSIPAAGFEAVINGNSTIKSETV